MVVVVPVAAREGREVTSINVTGGLKVRRGSADGEDVSAAHAAIPPEPVIDRFAARDRVGGDLALLARIVHLFLLEGPRMRSDLLASLERGDDAGVARVGHRLAVALAWIGAMPAARAALAVQGLGQTGDLLRVPAALATLDRELHRLNQALRAMVHGALG